MPFFKKKKSESSKGEPSKAEGEQSETKQPEPKAEAKPAEAKPAEAKPADAAQKKEEPAPQEPLGPPPKDLAFPVQLAHGSGTKKVKDFGTVKQLYVRIAEEFSLERRDLFFCTLGTDRVDTDRLLGGQIGLNDVIFVHVRGQEKDVTAMKSQAALGLTITDNGAGCAFIKRIKAGSISADIPEITVGDHISHVNGKDVFGVRHIEVARMLKEMPVGENFTLKLFSPQRSPFNQIAPRNTKGAASTGLTTGDSTLGTGKQTLRLKSTGAATVQTVDESSWTTKAAEAVDDCLESFMGIRDDELAETAVDAAKICPTLKEFVEKINEDLELFEFPESFVEEMWTVIQKVKVEVEGSK